jgi:hypothetical protein
MTLDQIFVGIFFAAFGILGLFLAAGASDGYMYFAGLAVFLASVAFNVHSVRAFCNKRWPK